MGLPGHHHRPDLGVGALGESLPQLAGEILGHGVDRRAIQGDDRDRFFPGDIDEFHPARVVGVVGDDGGGGGP